ncbi:50S ribosomal protein L11 methyltransferase [Muriicola marianensis]|uniref:Ribosomal protein L11 methyltransferase n=1 Tax=Muriicola marianensis TaxID=1324801 RepID=A0ABQ1R706_9FLAO|nr:50S ribosomal protein L11 methyltransferase [Muriicola marianensis]GGD56200.1 ribosomal protein L11 methyltransferase [Muriicola marianensis]
MSYPYLEYTFKVNPADPGRDILLAELSALPFESFEETENGLKAYVRKTDWREELLKEVHLLENPAFEVSYRWQEIPPENWNERWETHFEPIEIDERCRVRAPFHIQKDVQFDILIEPKMSFGTGHHATTHMMLEFLLDMDLAGKTVLDMGCGTAVLAILASMKGASEIDAVDIDPWSYENALENAEKNGQERIRVYQGDSSAIPQKKYDLILANINRNVLIDDIPVYVDHLEAGGCLLLSGFYDNDLKSITAHCNAHGLKLDNKKERNSWVAVKFLLG